eukprot:6537668-Prymnesium_polylepis.1
MSWFRGALNGPLVLPTIPHSTPPPAHPHTSPSHRPRRAHHPQSAARPPNRPRAPAAGSRAGRESPRTLARAAESSPPVPPPRVRAPTAA